MRYHGDGVLRLGDRVIEHVHADLIGGRSHYSVGGRVAEGPRWWRGRVEWDGDDDQPVTCSEVIIEVDNGRSGVAVIEPAPNAPAHSAVLHGVGPPPFEVP
ncbi:hypothetical protein NHL50_14930 [Acidimicrobiia bacterium EGI L10123]|uniref:hypothetical protein n=1 Tax=Salinilacustrithrix flava TaxID=2957203 RepID=UPI003D7C1E6E|nr:hypothetical protein [Acidimicrobiia bacterium EGI L10123]